MWTKLGMSGSLCVAVSALVLSGFALAASWDLFGATLVGLMLMGVGFAMYAYKQENFNDSK